MKKILTAAMAALGLAFAAVAAEAKTSDVRAVLVHLGHNMWCDWFPADVDTSRIEKGLPDAKLATRDDLWRKAIDHSAAKGMNMVVVDLGEGVVYPSHPELAIEGSWSPEKLKAELARMRALGLEVIPKLNFSTTHNGWLKQYRRMLSTPTYYKVCEDVLRDAYELFGRPRFIHIGCDEETATHQNNSGRCQLITVRKGEFWWHDFLHLVKTVEGLGARAWAWSDYGWDHPEEFAARCPKSVVLSNWYYDEADGGFDLATNKTADRKRLANYYFLRDHGYDQIPCATNWVGWKRRQGHKGADDVIGETVKLVRRDLAGEHLLGIMMAPWTHFCDDKRTDFFLRGVDLFADALAGKIAAPGMTGYDLEFYRQLMAIPSASDDIPQVNRAVDFTKDYFEKKGFFCSVETHPSGKKALYVATTPGKRHDIVLAPHLDVVPAVEGAPYELVVKGDKAYGRGSHDCKGNCAAVAKTLCDLKGRGVSVGCLFGSDEEVGGVVTTWMAEEMGYRPNRMVIVADGPFKSISYAIKGQTMFRIKAKGRGGHSARPWGLDDSIFALSKAYVRIREAFDRKYPLPADHWENVLTATVVRSDGTALNRIPDEVELVMNLRSVRPESKDEVKKLIEEASGYPVEIVRHSPPCACDVNDPLVQALRRSLSKSYGFDVRLDRMMAATDARCFANCGVPVVTLGVDGGDSHAKTEWERLSAIDQVADGLRDFILATFGK